MPQYMDLLDMLTRITEYQDELIQKQELLLQSQEELIKNYKFQHVYLAKSIALFAKLAEMDVERNPFIIDVILDGLKDIAASTQHSVKAYEALIEDESDASPAQPY